jgi:aminoglycoside phosphotransferase (APT) family kinase protein
MADAALEQLIDVAALERFVHANVPGANEPLDVKKHIAGFSNETFFVTCGEQRRGLRRSDHLHRLPFPLRKGGAQRLVAAHGLGECPGELGGVQLAGHAQRPGEVVERRAREQTFQHP